MLDWVCEDGFEAFFGRYGVTARTAHEVRQRHVIDAVRKRGW